MLSQRFYAHFRRNSPARRNVGRRYIFLMTKRICKFSLGAPRFHGILTEIRWRQRKNRVLFLATVDEMLNQIKGHSGSGSGGQRDDDDLNPLSKIEKCWRGSSRSSRSLWGPNDAAEALCDLSHTERDLSQQQWSLEQRRHFSVQCTFEFPNPFGAMNGPVDIVVVVWRFS